MKDLCAFKGWYGPQLFPDWPFLVRNLTLQAFQSFTLSVHVKMKWSLFLTMPPFDDRIIKASGSGQSMEARHTVQMALSLTTTAQLPLCPSVQNLAQAIQSARHPA